MDPSFRPFYSLDQLPILPRGIVVRQFSSHNRAGFNKDNFAVLYRDEHGDSVIFDATGPGCIRSMWSTEIPEDQVLLFYFDGEATPRFEIPSRQFFEGKHPLFRSPLNTYEKLGYYGELPFAGNSFTPIPFSDSLKIAIRGKVSFYHILFEQLPFGTHVETFTGQEDLSGLSQAFGDNAINESSESPFVEDPQHGDAEVVRVDVPRLLVNDELTLLDTNGAGTVREIVIEADGSPDFLSGVRLLMKWDQAHLYHVNCPVGHFFASPLYASRVEALPVQVKPLENGRVVLRSRFPMPYWQSAEIKLVNDSGHVLGPLKAVVKLQPFVYPKNRSGYFCTHYREGQTEYGRDWLFYSGPGTGWYVGVVQTMHGGHYCEGDEHFTLDHACSPQINGTGTEDYYLACFWPNRYFSKPFAGCVGDAFVEGGGNITGAYRVPGRYYRFHLDVPIPFYSHADLRIQHGAESNIRSSYTSLAFMYMSPYPACRQTDFIDVANPLSEQMHQYRADHSTVTEVVDGRFEGDLLHYGCRDVGRKHKGGDVHFTVAIDPQNEGVRIRRRIDQSVGRQIAQVYADGVYVGTWYHADENPYLRWYDSDFDIHPNFTRGKNKLHIQLKLGADGYPGRFTDFRYEVFSFLDPDTLERK